MPWKQVLLLDNSRGCRGVWAEAGVGAAGGGRCSAGLPWRRRGVGAPRRFTGKGAPSATGPGNTPWVVEQQRLVFLLAS